MNYDLITRFVAKPMIAIEMNFYSRHTMLCCPHISEVLLSKLLFVSLFYINTLNSL